MSHALAIAALPQLSRLAGAVALYFDAQAQSAPASNSALHALTVAVLPMLSLLAGVLSLFVNPERQPKARWIFLLLLFITGGSTVFGAVHDDQEKAESIKEQIAQLAKIDRIANNTDTMVEIMKSRGFDFDKIAKTSNSAEEALKETVRPAVLREGASSKVTIVYYPKDVDGPIVLGALKAGGFQIETAAGKPANAGSATNAIWVGDNVTVDQAKFVALTLVRAGVKINSIRRFRQGDGAKSFRIEVGTDRQLLQNPPMSVDQITNLKDIPQRNQASGDLVL